MPPSGSVSIARTLPKPAPPVEPRVVLVRHAHTALNAAAGKDRIRGWKDVPLDAEGKKEAKEIGALFAGCDVDLVIASDLSRAGHTAKAIAQETGARVTTTRQLRPWHLGDYQGEPSAKVIPYIHRHYVTEHPDEPVPGGESFNAFKARFLDFLADVLERARGRAAAIVLATHYRNLKTAEAWLAAGAKDGKLDRKTFMTDSLFPGAILMIRPGEKPEGELLFKGFEAGGSAGKTAS